MHTYKYIISHTFSDSVIGLFCAFSMEVEAIVLSHQSTKTTLDQLSRVTYPPVRKSFPFLISLLAGCQ